MVTSDLFENDRKTDAYVVIDEANRFYFTHLDTSFGAVIISREKNVFITDFRYESEARAKLADFEIEITKFSAFYTKIAEVLASVGATTVGYGEKMYIDEFHAFKTALAGFKLKPVESELAAKRAIKTDEEIGYIRTAQQIAEGALKRAMSRVKPGITERELMADINYEMIIGGAEKYSFETIVAFGANSARPHHHPTDKKLDRNDLILVDMGAKYNGYCSDMSRTFGLGAPDGRLVEIYSIVKEAQEYAIKNIKAGMTCHDADALAREYITSNGYGENFGHSLGHGVGVEIHEFPRLGSNSESVLQPNMVVTIEPGIYVSGLGGVRIEDMLVIGANGATNLTSYDKKFSI